MTTPRQAARQRRHRRRLIFGAAAAVISAGLLASLLMALLPGRDAGARSAASTPAGVTTAVGTRTPTAATPRATSSPTPKSSSTKPARPSPSATARPSRKPATPAQAGRIRPNTPYKGVATAYEAADGNGACLFGPSPDLMVAAMNTTDYETAKACGAHVLVRAANGKSITVRITNECPDRKSVV